MKKKYQEEIRKKSESLKTKERNKTSNEEKKYFNQFMKNKRLEYRLRAVAKKIKRGKVLDVGCKWAVIYQYLKHKDIEYTGFDFSEESLKLAEKKAQNCTFVLGDAYKLPFKANSFDYVIFTEIIEHFENPGLVLKECLRVLKKGGKIIGTTPNATEVIRVVKALFRRCEGSVAHLVLFGKFELEMLLKCIGFTKVNVDFIYFNFLRGRNKKDCRSLGYLFPYFKKFLIFTATK